MPAQYCIAWWQLAVGIMVHELPLQQCTNKLKNAYVSYAR